MENRTRTEEFLSDGDSRAIVKALCVAIVLGLIALLITLSSGGDFESPVGIVTIIAFGLTAILMTPTGSLFLLSVLLDVYDASKGRTREEKH